MKLRSALSILLASLMLVTTVACSDKESDTKSPETNNTAVKNDTDIPDAYYEPMAKLLSEWGIRKGAMSDPLIGTRILMYEKTKDEIGYMLVDLDGNGVDELVTAPFDEYTSNGMVYDILTIKDGKAFHLANSLQATYHLCEDNTFILRTPTADKSFTFKTVEIDGTNRPIETEITKEESSTRVLSTIKLTPFSALEK